MEDSSQDVTAGELSPSAPPSGSAPQSAHEIEPASVAAPTPGVASEPGQTQSQVDAETTAVSPSSSEQVPDSLKGVPTLEELQSAPKQPYRDALINLRAAHERHLEQSASQLAQLDPYRALSERGAPEELLSRLELTDSLFTPVLQDGVEVRDPETGLPLTTTRPFIERLRSDAPGTSEQLLTDLLTLEDPSGQRGIDRVFEVLGLDFNRLEEYRATSDAATRNQGAVSASDLELISPPLREAFSSFSPHEREDLLLLSDAARDAVLADRQQIIAARREREQYERQRAHERQQELMQIQEQAVSSLKSETYQSIRQNLLTSLKFSEDGTANEFGADLTMSALITLLDPTTRSFGERLLKSAGADFDAARFDELTARLETRARQAAALERGGDRMRAQAARADLSQARTQLAALCNGFALKIAKHQLQQQAARASSTDAEIARAQLSARPPLPGSMGASTAASATTTRHSILPPGIEPGSEAAMRYIYERTIGARLG